MQSEPTVTSRIKSLSSPLEFFAWASLGVGLLLAIYAWTNLSQVEIETRFGDIHKTNPAGIILGFALTGAGTFCCLVFLSLRTLLLALDDIRRALPTGESESPTPQIAEK